MCRLDPDDGLAKAAVIPAEGALVVPCRQDRGGPRGAAPPRVSVRQHLGAQAGEDGLGIEADGRQHVGCDGRRELALYDHPCRHLQLAWLRQRSLQRCREPAGDRRLIEGANVVHRHVTVQGPDAICAQMRERVGGRLPRSGP